MDRSAMILLQITLCLTVLVVETYSSMSGTREILHRTKRQAECKPDEFKCTSGECIDIVSMCDGTKKCADGSDETEITCKQLNITGSPSPPEGGCLLPRPPEFGAYTSPLCQFDKKTAACRQLPETSVPQNWLLSFKCNEGYYLKETQDANIYVFCVDGKWSPKIPVCRKMCSPLVSLTVDTRCVNKGGETDCSKPMRPGTRATVQCKPSYITTSPNPYKEIFCTDKGQWSGELFYCEPACGRRNWKGVNTPLIAHGSAAKPGEFPWHVGIYAWVIGPNDWEQYCGGSLISPHIVLTAAGCVFSNLKRTPLDPEAIKVGLGKYYREWSHDEPYAVQADVREILIPPGYSGYATSYAQNIALLDLTRSVQLHAGIMPVCVDWKREFTITPGALGTVAGWGKTEHGKRSDVLLLADFPYVDYSHCINLVAEEDLRYVTSDKFCGGYTNGTGVQYGYGGGGLTFVQDDLYYVYGIASSFLPYSNNSLTTFTKINIEEIFNWLISSKNKFDKEHDEEYPEKPSILSPKGGECLLPQQPEFGAYTGALCALKNETAACRQGPGTLVYEGWLLSFKCSEGYYIKETKDENFYTFCLSGQWSKKIPACRKMCSPLVSLSVAVSCFNGEGDIDCNKPMRPGTRAKVECKPLYTHIGPTPYSEIICRENGQWSRGLFSCDPECGQRNVQGNPLIVYGSSANYNEFPWHVGLYSRNASNQWEQICGGSLISPHIVLTAAHCVSIPESIATTLFPETIKVGLGKFYREWNHKEEFAVKADVREIVIPPRFHGHSTSLALDIALVDLTDSVQVHTGIMPVCVDWQHKFTVTPGMRGTLAGWGKTEKGISSDVLLYADLPYVDRRNCFIQTSQPFRRYITPDKFCAGYTNGTGAAEGDSGGGLTFVWDGLYYLHGVVSSKAKGNNSFITFTNVSNVELFNWLNEAKHKLDAAHR